MKTLIAAVALTATMSCGVLTSVLGPVWIHTEGPTGRQVQRVLDRHEAYLVNDATLATDDFLFAIEQSNTVSAIMESPMVSASVLATPLLPVMARHDAYVEADALIDDLDREGFLATTAGLRTLLAAAQPTPR